MDEQVTIYIVGHKPFEPLSVEGYQPIAVGNLASNPPKGFISDKEGESISEKNAFYCELTAQYWIWKNDTQSDYIGLVHYRRLFLRDGWRMRLGDLLTAQDAVKYLSNCDVLVPEKLHWDDVDVAECYYIKGQGKEKDLETAREAISSLFPFDLDSFDKVIHSHDAFYCNMAIMRKSLFNDYCEWLFTVLSYIEERIDLSTYTKSEKRVFGYLSEILLNVYVESRKLQYLELPVLRTDSNWLNQMLHSFKRRLTIRSSC